MIDFKLTGSIFAILMTCSACSFGQKAVVDSPNRELNQIEHSKFAVVYSQVMDRGCEFANYDQAGKKLSSVTLKDCVGFTSSTQSDQYAYYSSNRSNFHVSLDKETGKVSPLHTKSLSTSTEDEGAFFINYSNGYVLHDINVGYTDEGYGGELVYWTEDGKVKEQFELKGELTSAIFDQQNIYALLENDENTSISTIDPISHREKRKKLNIDSVFFP